MTATLTTWLMEGVIAVCAVAVLTRAFRLNAATRYVAWWSALVAVGAFVWTFSPVNHECSPLAGGCGTPTAPSEPLVYVISVSSLLLSAFVGVWLSIALVRLLRVLSSLHAIYALRDRCTVFPAAIEAQLPMWSQARTHGRRADLALCDAVASATVLGFHRPCIAVPPHLLESLTAAELDHVILHEHAHVQRRDDWSRLAQELVQSMLWVHPAAGVIGRQLDREREMACDEWVVARTGRPKVYARCLARAAEAIAQARSQGFAGAAKAAHYGLTPALCGRAHELVRRVDRLLGMRAGARYTISVAGAVVVAVAIAGAIAGLRAANVVGEIGAIAAPLESVRALSVLRPIAVRVAGGSNDALPARRQARSLALTTTTSAEQTEDIVAQIPATTPISEPEHAVGVLEARAIAGSYASQAGVAPPAQPGTWTRVGTTAAQIGVTAGKASANLGTIFGRAGTSLARRF